MHILVIYFTLMYCTLKKTINLHIYIYKPYLNIIPKNIPPQDHHFFSSTRKQYKHPQIQQQKTPKKKMTGGREGKNKRSVLIKQFL